jgi:hypothetical protein
MDVTILVLVEAVSLPIHDLTALGWWFSAAADGCVLVGTAFGTQLRRRARALNEDSGQKEHGESFAALRAFEADRHRHADTQARHVDARKLCP